MPFLLCCCCWYYCHHEGLHLKTPEDPPLCPCLLALDVLRQPEAVLGPLSEDTVFDPREDHDSHTLSACSLCSVDAEAAKAGRLVKRTVVFSSRLGAQSPGRSSSACPACSGGRLVCVML